MAPKLHGHLTFFLILFGVAAVLVAGTTTFTTTSSSSSSGDRIKSCPVNFETANYTVITSRCKAPKYTASLCCQAFKEFACPFAKYITDPTNDCASTMFAYIDLYGHYPAGLFATLCRRKHGITCP